MNWVQALDGASHANTHGKSNNFSNHTFVMGNDLPWKGSCIKYTICITPILLGMGITVNPMLNKKKIKTKEGPSLSQVDSTTAGSWTCAGSCWKCC